MTRRTSIPPPGTPVDPLYVAHDALTALGHVPLYDHGQYACWRCPLEGRLRGAIMSGEIFEEKCR